jgi:beta-galactosidase GanA
MLLFWAYRSFCLPVSNFTKDRNSWYLDGKKYIMIGGQIDPQRVPRAFWANRLQVAKAMGVNTIFSYIYWNEFEPTQGNFNFAGQNDIAAWYQTVQSAGLNAVLRTGPYVCGERDWGGFPYWLANVSGLTVRTNNTPFLNAVKSL